MRGVARRLAMAVALVVATTAAAEEAVQDAATERVVEPTLLHWKARSEGRIYGYLVYRALERSGPYLRWSREIVRVPGDSLEEHGYEFSDDRVEACTTYFYYLDQVTRSGIKTRFSGVLSKATQCPRPPDVDE